MDRELDCSIVYHSQPFLQTHPEMIRAYDFLSSAFIYDIMESLIAQLKGCLLECFD